MSMREAVPLQPLLDARQLAEALHCSIYMARQLLRENALPCVQIGRLRRVRPEDVLAFIAARTNGQKP